MVGPSLPPSLVKSLCVQVPATPLAPPPAPKTPTYVMLSPPMTNLLYYRSPIVVYYTSSVALPNFTALVVVVVVGSSCMPQLLARVGRIVLQFGVNRRHQVHTTAAITGSHTTACQCCVRKSKYGFGTVEFTTNYFSELMCRGRLKGTKVDGTGQAK